jgi:cyclophilin family peptidyl-prolyl cis-trans isomerase
MKKQVTAVMTAIGIGVAASGADAVTVQFETSMGNIVAELDSARAPKTVANIVAYVNDGFYDGTIFHRVIKGFMIQGGGMTPDMKEKSNKAPVKNEASNGLRNVRGTLAMARTNDPHSATSQFFVNTVNNAFLDFTPQNWGYCVFGKVVKGMDVVDAIEKTPTANAGMHSDVPVTPVIIKSAKVVVAEKTAKPAAQKK